MLLSKLQRSIKESIVEEISKHLGIDGNLTSSQTDNYVQQVEITYEPLLRKQNQVKLFETHLKNGTTNPRYYYCKFPKPNLEYDSIFVDSYNELIRETQVKMQNLCISRLKEQIKVLERDLLVTKNFLRDSFDDIYKLFRSISDEKMDFLKKEFDASNAKCLKIITKPFVV
jgi:hypothetical protein